jgi:flagellar protein FliL
VFSEFAAASHFARPAFCPPVPVFPKLHTTKHLRRAIFVRVPRRVLVRRLNCTSVPGSEERIVAASGSATATAKSSVVSMLTIALLAVICGGGSAWFVIQRAKTADTAHADSGLAPKYTVHLEGFTVNLADTEETHFLRVTMDLGIDRLPEGIDREKPAAGMPVARIRDAVLSVLTVSKAAPLLTPEGKEQLKKNLLDALRRQVPELDVRDVYFTEFLVQR